MPLSPEETARYLLHKMWQAKMLSHRLTTTGAYLLTPDGTETVLSAEESALFYTCTAHGGVLDVGDKRCQRHMQEQVLAENGMLR